MIALLSPMTMKFHLWIKILLILYLFAGCLGKAPSNTNNSNTTNNRSISISPNKISAQSDSVSLIVFWENFRSYINQKNVATLKSALIFPIFGEIISVFHFSVSCDTMKYIEEQGRFDTVKINKDNLEEYFSFVFDDNFIHIIKQIDHRLLFQEIKLNDTYSGGLLRIDAQNFGFDCESDHELRLAFYKTEETWQVHINGI